jgi:hypothetical protein
MAAPFRFFDNQPQKGRPIALKGVAAGLAKLARAVERIEIFGGRVDWHNGEPLLIPPEFNGYSSGASDPMPFDIRITGTQIETYMPGGVYNVSSANARVYGQVYVNGIEIPRFDGVGERTALGMSADSPWWPLDIYLPSDGNSVSLWFNLDFVDITGTDLTTADALRFAIDQYDINSAMWKAFVLATIRNTGGVYAIRQYHRGSIKINPPFPDSLSSTTIGSDLHKTRSITTQADYGAGSMTLYGFKAGSAISPTPDITETGFRFLVRRLVSGIVTLQYLSGESLTSIIEDVIEDNPPAYPSPPDNEGWSGWWDDEC